MSGQAHTQTASANGKRPRYLLRSIGAIVAGLLVIVVLSVGTDVILHATGVYPPWFHYMPDSLFLLATAYRSLYSVLGCYITARLAPDRPMRHALILGVVGVVLSTLGAISTWNQGPEFGPKWYPITLVVISIPLAWVGGELRLLQLNRRSEE
jgi:surface polysaccharide O-acyltransferase-like enzyme